MLQFTTPKQRSEEYTFSERCFGVLCCDNGKKVLINISDKKQRESIVKNLYVSYIWVSLFSLLTKRFTFSCTAIPLLFHVVLATVEAYISGPPYLSPLDISPSATMSQLLLHRDHLYSCVRQDFASALETDDCRSAPYQGCMRDFPRFLYLRNHTSCKLIF